VNVTFFLKRFSLPRERISIFWRKVRIKKGSCIFCMYKYIYLQNISFYGEKYCFQAFFNKKKFPSKVKMRFNVEVEYLTLNKIKQLSIIIILHPSLNTIFTSKNQSRLF